MLALTINFSEKPKDLGDLMERMIAFEKLGDSVWIWRSGCGNILLLVHEDPYSVEIQASNNSGIMQKRIFRLQDTMEWHYKGCEAKPNWDFYR